MCLSHSEAEIQWDLLWWEGGLELKVTRSLVMPDPRVMGKNQLKEQNLMSRSGRDKFQAKVK